LSVPQIADSSILISAESSLIFGIGKLSVRIRFGAIITAALTSLFKLAASIQTMLNPPYEVGEIPGSSDISCELLGSQK
jgi:hypothetical protein